jgi:hypothetical protein
MRRKRSVMLKAKTRLLRRQMMNQNKAKQLFDAAIGYCNSTTELQQEIEWIRSITEDTFNNIDSQSFLEQYCWVVYVSGFQVNIIEAIFGELKEDFKDFNLDELKNMTDIRTVRKVFNSPRKAECFLKGSHMIANEGFDKFKKHVKEGGVDELEKLPGIGPITKYHLARNIGLIDTEKSDIWMKRAAEMCATNTSKLVDFLVGEYKLKRRVVDAIIWRYGADKQFVGLL